MGASITWKMVPGLAVQLAAAFKDDIAVNGTRADVFAKLAGDYDGITSDPDQMLFRMFPKAPPPLLAMLVGGLTGAGLGYGASSLASRLFPRTWDRDKLRKSMTLGGAAMGTVPGLLYGLSNVVGPNKTFFNDNWLNRTKKPFIPEAKTTEKISVLLVDDYEAVVKQSYMTGLGGFKPVPVDEFNRVIWQDPYVAGRLDPAVQAAATGAVTGAANLPGKSNSGWVTPMDMGRMAAGMGSGYISGALVGAALGTLMGMPADTQNKLRQTGMYAGIVSAIVPKLFGG